MPAAKNRYYRHSKISEAKFRRLLRAFALDLTASDAARLTPLSTRSTNAIYLRLRQRLARYCKASSPLRGHVEVDESYFGPRRVRGKKGRGAGSKTIVFGIFKRNGHVYTEIIPDVSQRTLRRAIRGRVSLDSVIHSDYWHGYNGLVDMGYVRHVRIRHSDNQFARGSNHINGIESFWSYAKRRLARFNGIRQDTFYLHLKETEFRFNHRRDNLYQTLLKLLREEPL